MSDEQKAELWRRWKQGESLSDIGRALGKVPGSIHNVVSAHGGVPPTARCRAPHALSLAEREEISRGLAANKSLRVLAGELGRAPSTISREVERNGGRRAYRAHQADERAWANARRPKPCRLTEHRRLQATVAAKLADDWSPEQIAGWLRQAHPDEPEMQVSHETIYLSLFVQARRALDKQLTRHLRSHRSTRRCQRASTAGQRRGRIVDATPIHQRPAEVESRAVPGHWEGDLVAGADNSHVATLVERSSRYLVLVKVPGKDTHSVITALTHRLARRPELPLKTLTWDRGTELAAHKTFTAKTGVPVYFCDPQAPWQRGTNENTNGLLRQYLPKGLNVRNLTQQQLDALAHKLNTRPRKTLGYRTPADTLQLQGVALNP